MIPERYRGKYAIFIEDKVFGAWTFEQASRISMQIEEITGGRAFFDYIETEQEQKAHHAYSAVA